MIPITIRGNGELSISRCTCAGIAVSSDRQTLITTSLPVPPAPQAVPEPNGSYGQILKSSALIGGSQVANIAIRVIRTKAMAVLLGPAGFGLFGLYGSIADLTLSVAGMGINSSGVRQIAEAVGSGDGRRIAQTAAVLKRTSIVLGLLGALLLLVFCRQVSGLTFGSTERAGTVSLLSIAVFFGLVAGGQGALIQGMRRIADLAQMNVLGALFGMCTSVPLVYFFREKGVVPALVTAAGMTILTSWWYSRKIELQTSTVTLSQVWQEASALLKLGSAFMASGFMTIGVAYLVRTIIVRKIGFEATGLYQSAWTLGGLYVGFILQAMGADFYPRLTAVSKNNSECNRLVNEQTLVGLLLAGPGVISTISFAPLVISLFYSAKFALAVGILRWISLGVTLQVITWPMGFIIVAKGKAHLFFFAELAWTVIAVVLAWVCLTFFDVNGAGIAFFGSYIFHAFLVYPIVYWLSGFRWSAQNRRTGVGLLSVVTVVFCSSYVLPPLFAGGIGLLATILTGVYSIRVLARLVSVDRIPPAIRHFIKVLGIAHPT